MFFHFRMVMHAFIAIPAKDMLVSVASRTPLGKLACRLRASDHDVSGLGKSTKRKAGPVADAQLIKIENNSATWCAQ
jgi:hypothetical protein